jgi:hypothetical protein
MRSPNGAVVAELQNLARAVHRKLDRRLTLRRGEVTVSPFGRPARFKVRNSLDYARLVVGSDELEVLGALIERLRPDDLFWDVAGHLGLFSLHVVQAIGADRVIVFEPDPEYAARLRTDLDLNGLQAVRIQTCALTDKPRTDTLRTAGTSGPSWSLGNQTQHQPNACTSGWSAPIRRWPPDRTRRP